MPMWCVAPLEMNGGEGTIGLHAAVKKKHHMRPLTYNGPILDVYDDDYI